MITFAVSGDPDDDFLSSTLSLEQRRADRVRRMTRATNNAVLSVLLASANLVQIGAKLVAAAVLPHGDVSLAGSPNPLVCGGFSHSRPTLESRLH